MHQACFLVVSDFCGVNTPTMTDPKLPRDITECRGQQQRAIAWYFRHTDKIDVNSLMRMEIVNVKKNNKEMMSFQCLLPLLSI